MTKLLFSLFILTTIGFANCQGYQSQHYCHNPKGCHQTNSNSDHNDQSVTNQQTEKKTTKSDKEPDCSKCECKESRDCCKKCVDKCKNTGCSTGEQSSGDNSTSPKKGLTEEEVIVEEDA